MQLSDLNKLIKKIDRRISKIPFRGTIQPKKRIPSFASESEPPQSFPDWAVKLECRAATFTSCEPSSRSTIDSTSDSSDIDD